MKFGLYSPNLGPFGDARVIADLTQKAESAGWDGFFLWDHIATHVEKGLSLARADPRVALTAAAPTSAEPAGLTALRDRVLSGPPHQVEPD